MSQSGYTPIQLYRTTTASATPSAGNLSAGELAINLTDEKLFFKNASGTVKVLASTGAGNAGGSNTQVQYNSSGVLTGSSNFVFDGTNVGIGTSSPGAKLVVSEAGTGFVSFAPANAATSLVMRLGYNTDYSQITADSFGGNLFIGADESNTKANSYIAFRTDASEKMRIDSSGNVGIGVTPLTRLDVSTSGGSRIRTDTSSSLLVTQNITNAAANAYITSRTDAFDYQIYTSGSEKMRIDNSGNVGIGTSSFTSRLTVQQDQAAYSYFDFYNVTNGGGVVWRQVVRNIANTGTTSVDIAKLIGGGFVINNNDTDSSNFTAFSVGASERFRITSTGGITSSNVADAVGYKGLPQNAQTSSYTLALSDMGKHISITTGGVVIPANASVAFPIGSAIAIYNNSGSNQTISITSDTLRQAGTANTGSRTLAQYGLCTVTKVASTTWVISGAGVS